MARRIIGQCSTSDFKYLEHLSDILMRGGDIDTSNLTNRQKIAVQILRHFNECGVEFSVLLKIREVLVWESENRMYFFEYKLINPNDTETMRILRSMRKV